MKRVLCLTLMLLLLFLLVACQDEPQYWCGTALEQMTRVELKSYEEYCAFIDVFSPVPTGFVPYECISFLGEFKGFSCNLAYMSSLVHLGGYELIDGSKTDFNLRYVHLYEYDEVLQNEYLEIFEIKNTFDEVEHKENSIQVIRPLPDTSSVMSKMATSYKRNDIVFQYKERELLTSNGEPYIALVLFSVTWVYNGTLFEISNISSYPSMATGTFVSRLLNPDTVDAAVVEFNLRVKGY